MDWPAALQFSDIWRGLSVLVLAWLAVFFGKTLRHGDVPLIERIARVSDPAMTQPLRRYTRGLTMLWCAYFVLAALLTLVVRLPGGGAWVWLGTAVLFIGERALRPFIFPNKAFPGLVRQLRDTWSVWHRPGGLTE